VRATYLASNLQIPAGEVLHEIRRSTRIHRPQNHFKGVRDQLNIDARQPIIVDLDVELADFRNRKYARPSHTNQESLQSVVHVME